MSMQSASYVGFYTRLANLWCWDAGCPSSLHEVPVAACFNADATAVLVHQGKTPWNKGLKLSLETRQKMALAKAARTLPRMMRRRMAKAHVGKKHTAVRPPHDGPSWHCHAVNGTGLCRVTLGGWMSQSSAWFLTGRLSCAACS